MGCVNKESVAGSIVSVMCVSSHLPLNLPRSSSASAKHTATSQALTRGAFWPTHSAAFLSYTSCSCFDCLVYDDKERFLDRGLVHWTTLFLSDRHSIQPESSAFRTRRTINNMASPVKRAGWPGAEQEAKRGRGRAVDSIKGLVALCTYSNSVPLYAQHQRVTYLPTVNPLPDIPDRAHPFPHPKRSAVPGKDPRPIHSSNPSPLIHIPLPRQHTDGNALATQLVHLQSCKIILSILQHRLRPQATLHSSAPHRPDNVARPMLLFTAADQVWCLRRK
jgi:hypothetical protein